MVANVSSRSVRAARGLLKWSLRDLERESGVALKTLQLLEADRPYRDATAHKIAAAFTRWGVELLNGNAPGARQRLTGPADLTGLQFVIARRRVDGTYRVLFEVPARRRPPGWRAATPLPIRAPRTGDLSSPDEVRRIKADAEALLEQLHQDREIDSGGT